MAQRNRRTFLQGIASGLALAGVGTAAGHPDGRHDPSDGSHEIHRHNASKNADLVGYHSLGGFGGEDTGGQPENAAEGVISETWVEGDHVFVSYQSSAENRGVAILDASQYTRADGRDELAAAELSLIATIGNETEAGTANDVKVSDDGDLLVYSKQAIGADYGKPVSTSTATQDAPGAEPQGLIAYDISEPGDPTYIGSASGPNAGFHNCFVHEIGGEYYAFGVQGVAPGSAGVHIYRVTDHGLEFVNFWGGGDLRQGEYESPGTGYLAAGFYCHDLYVHDDPVTGRPVGYVAYWNHGVRVIDLSDPADIVELGYGDMNRAHYAQPAPTTIDGKRVFIGGQEFSARSKAGAGYVRLFDGDALFEEGVTELPALDSWELYDDVTYSGYAFSPHNADITEDGWITQAHYHAGVRFLKIRSPAESDTGDWRLAGKRVDRNDADDRERIDTGERHSFSGQSGVDAYGNAGNYRIHEFTSPLDEPAVLETELTWSPAAAELDLYVDRRVDGGWQPVAQAQSPAGFKTVRFPVDPGADYRYRVETDIGPRASYTLNGRYFRLGALPEAERADIEEPAIAYYRDHVEVPAESRTGGDVTPNFWSARIGNGVTFAGGINSGLYAIATDAGVGPAVGTRTPVDLSVARTDDAGLFLAGQTDRIDFEVTADEPVRVRTRIPSSWEVVGGDPHTTDDVGDGTMVEFTATVPPHDHAGHDHGDGEQAPTRTLFVEAPAESGSYRFGPFEYSTDGGGTWEPVPDTFSDERVLGTLL